MSECKVRTRLSLAVVQKSSHFPLSTRTVGKAPTIPNHWKLEGVQLQKHLISICLKGDWHKRYTLQILATRGSVSLGLAVSISSGHYSCDCGPRRCATCHQNSSRTQCCSCGHEEDHGGLNQSSKVQEKSWWSQAMFSKPDALKWKSEVSVWNPMCTGDLRMLKCQDWSKSVKWR